MRPFVVIIPIMAKKESIKVFYDGGCLVCDSEISVYKRISKESGIEFINISEPGFEAGTYDKTRDDFMQALHVLDERGKFHSGVDAFRLLWQHLPGAHYHLLSTMTGLPGISQVADIGYGIFARNRHWLPRKKGPK